MIIYFLFFITFVACDSSCETCDGADATDCLTCTADDYSVNVALSSGGTCEGKHTHKIRTHSLKEAPRGLLRIAVTHVT